MASRRSMTTLTDVAMITCVVQRDNADAVTNALLEIGIQGASVHAAMGTGVRERLGVLGVAVDVERSVISLMVARDQVNRIFERMYLAGRLDTPGMGFMYVTPLLQAATYVPPHVLERVAQERELAGA